jgi:polyphosphate kinase 2 (PPK2 family)
VLDRHGRAALGEPVELGLHGALRPGVECARGLVEEGTSIVKVFLHVSKDEQLERFKERLDDPEKAWKFRAADLDVHERYADYMAAYDEAIAETSTEWAPWHVVPADHNWVKALAVAELLVAELERMDPQLPEPDPETAKIKL